MEYICFFITILSQIMPCFCDKNKPDFQAFLSRTLRTMANSGLVRIEGGLQGRGRRAVKPVAVARCVNLTLDIGFGDKPAPRIRRQTEHVTA